MARRQAEWREVNILRSDSGRRIISAGLDISGGTNISDVPAGSDLDISGGTNITDVPAGSGYIQREEHIRRPDWPHDVLYIVST